MDSAKDSGREMLAAINVEGSGFWLLFLFLSQFFCPTEFFHIQRCGT
ncbi:hypothetical protein U4O66_20850 [Klebsiella pneumoniae]|nr:hypothetical protein [Klebsiella pneumoniae]